MKIHGHWGVLLFILIQIKKIKLPKVIAPHVILVDKIINPTTTLQQYECQLVEPNVPKFSESIQDYVCSVPYSYASREHEAPAKIQCYPSSIYPQDQIVAANQMEYIDAIMSSLPTSTSVSSSQIVTTLINPSSLEP